jgi:hypothetical protein
MGDRVTMRHGAGFSDWTVGLNLASDDRPARNVWGGLCQSRPGRTLVQSWE